MKILVAITTFLLCVGVMLFSVNFVAYNVAFYDFQFRLNDTAAVMGLSAEELAVLRDKVIAYISGRTNVLEIDIFTAYEISHMTDARAIFIAVRVLSWVLLIGAMLALIGLYLVDRRRRKASQGEGGKRSGELSSDFSESEEKRFFAKGMIWGNAVFLGLIGLVGLFALFGWDTAFDVFHEIFFPQGNWQFPHDSALIQMFPVQFFISATWIMVGSAVVFAVVGLVSAVIVTLLRNKPKNKLT